MVYRPQGPYQWPHPIPAPRPRQPVPWGWVVALAVTVASVLAAVTIVYIDASKPSKGLILADPGAAIAEAPAVDFVYSYTLADGSTANGAMTVTEDGYASGTITDALGGAAEYRATPEGETVLGDQSWWGRRAPEQAGALAGKWVATDPGIAFPLDVAGSLTPDALADRIRTVNTEGRVLDTDLGAGLVAIEWEEWTLVRTTDLPSETVSLTGPIGDDLTGGASLGHASAPSTRHSTVSTEPVFVQGGSGTGTLGGPAPAPAEAAETVAEEATDPAATADGEAAEPPIQQSEVVPLWPSFQATINAGTCSTPTCSWSGTVSNNGTGPGSATVTASVSPGMPPVTTSLGTIAPGGSASTGTMSFGNPAPTPAPGQTSSIMVLYSLIVYSPELHGSNPERYRSLVEKLGGQEKQPRLDQALSKVDPNLATGLVDALSRMADSGTEGETVLDAADTATEADPQAGEYSDVPLLESLASAGDRFNGWDAVAQGLTSTDPDTVLDFQAGVQAAIDALTLPSQPTVTLIPSPRPDGGTDSLVITQSPDSLECTQVTRALDGDVPSAAVAAAESLNDPSGPAADYRAECTARIRVNPSPTTIPSPSGLSTARQLQEILPGSTMCAGGPSFDQVAVGSGTEVMEWPAATLCAATPTEMEQAQLELLNGLDVDESILQGLAGAGAITLEGGEVTGITPIREENNKCKPPAPTYGPEHYEQYGSHSLNLGGNVASGAARYLCGKLTNGQYPGSEKPWDWPNLQLRVGKQFLFAACHLLARQLGGNGNTENLVTCYHPSTNNAYMNPFEQEVRDSINDEHHAIYIATPYFLGDSNEEPDDEGIVRPPYLTGIRVTVIPIMSGMPLPPIDVCFPNTLTGGTAPGASCTVP
ncbi:DNA/RNA non-specific endonuclease [Glycomyces dulcitolivorans]|uniref:DNA/RNA non-specific endonuclease n=1 Tax=Glycomyces dulcitolivorans TaxID=2200759 RepID=UPI000DD37ABF|nr:DNA/RNA non-specific endonuclease [Glycomyces dulcitolivorans]